LTDLRALDLQIGFFTYRQIKAATNNFDAANKIGEGGFGSVYKVAYNIIFLQFLDFYVLCLTYPWYLEASNYIMNTYLKLYIFLFLVQGILLDGTIIAVKRLSSKSNQGNREFVNEIGMISSVQHPNLVRLYGCCVEGNQLFLVYEYMENNSLARALFGKLYFSLQYSALIKA